MKVLIKTHFPILRCFPLLGCTNMGKRKSDMKQKGTADCSGESSSKKIRSVCIIHHSSISESEKLISPNDLASWKSLVNAATIRHHEPILNLISTLDDETLPADVYYHAKCRSLFTMKRELEKILKLSQGPSDTEQKERILREKASGSRIYDKTICIFCNKSSKYLKKSHTREELRSCVELRADENVRQAAEQKNDGKILALSSRDLVAAEASYHGSCYKDYTRQPKQSEATSIAMHVDPDEQLYMDTENEALEKLFDFIRNDIFEKPRTVTMISLKEKLSSWIHSAGIKDVKDSTTRHLKRKLETEFSDTIIIFKTQDRKLLVMPRMLSAEMLAEEVYTLSQELDILKSDLSNKSNIINKAAIYLHDDVKATLKDYPMSWPPDPVNLNKEHINLPSTLSTFLEIILTGKQSTNITHRISWAIMSIGQDLQYSVSQGQYRPPKHIILSSAIKSLTGNVECIKILNRLGHCVSYSILEEIDTALVLQKLAMLPRIGFPLPSNIMLYMDVTLGWDNVNRLEETLSGAGTSHRVNGMIAQPVFYGPHKEVKMDIPEIAKLGQRSIDLTDKSIPISTMQESMWDLKLDHLFSAILQNVKQRLSTKI